MLLHIIKLKIKKKTHNFYNGTYMTLANYYKGIIWIARKLKQSNDFTFYLIASIMINDSYQYIYIKNVANGSMFNFCVSIIVNICV